MLRTVLLNSNGRVITLKKKGRRLVKHGECDESERNRAMGFSAPAAATAFSLPLGLLLW